MARLSGVDRNRKMGEEVPRKTNDLLKAATNHAAITESIRSECVARICDRFIMMRFVVGRWRSRAIGDERRHASRSADVDGCDEREQPAKCDTAGASFAGPRLRRWGDEHQRELHGSFASPI